VSAFGAHETVVNGTRVGLTDRVAGSAQDPVHLHHRRPRTLRKLQYAVLAAAAVHGGTEPDLLQEVAYWQTDDFWQYATYAAVAYIHAAASRAGVPVRRACQDLSERPGHPAR
jgi:hypothetical protein